MSPLFDVEVNRSFLFFLRVRCQVRQTPSPELSIVARGINAYPLVKKRSRTQTKSLGARSERPLRLCGTCPSTNRWGNSTYASKISRRTVVLIGFLIATAISTAYAVPVAENYYQFYPSLSRIQLSLTDLQLKNITEYITVKASFTVVNPTDYKGFILTIFRGVYELEKNNITVARGGALPSPLGFITRPLDKNVLISVFLPFNATYTSVKNVQVVFDISLVLSTFLDGFGPVIITYLCQGTGGPGNCYLTTISAQGSFPGGGARGGGV